MVKATFFTLVAQPGTQAFIGVHYKSEYNLWGQGSLLNILGEDFYKTICGF